MHALFNVPAGATGKPSTAKAAKAPPSCPSTAPARPTPSMAVGEDVEEEEGRWDGSDEGMDDRCWLGGVGVKAQTVVTRTSTSPDRTVEGLCLLMLELCRVHICVREMSDLVDLREGTLSKPNRTYLPASRVSFTRMQTIRRK